jgi:S-adenosylmethionine decarboxylase
MWKNLAPDLLRQRVVIEGTTTEIIKPDQIKSYLTDLADVAGMEVLSGPFAYTAHEMGFGGWIHWKSSGSHFYSYPTNPPLFTVDIYTCKPFDPGKVVEFTKKYFGAIEVVWKEVEV